MIYLVDPGFPGCHIYLYPVSGFGLEIWEAVIICKVFKSSEVPDAQKYLGNNKHSFFGIAPFPVIAFNPYSCLGESSSLRLLFLWIGKVRSLRNRHPEIS